MSDRKVIAEITISGSYGNDTVRVEEMKRGRFAGRFVMRGAGYAGRVAYRSIETIRKIAERDVRFLNWTFI